MAFTQLACSCGSVKFRASSVVTKTVKSEYTSEEIGIFVRTEDKEWVDHLEYDERTIEGRPGDYITLTWYDNEVDHKKNSQYLDEVDTGHRSAFIDSAADLTYNFEEEYEEEEDQEVSHVFCDECGEIFNEHGYNVYVEYNVDAVY